MKPYRIAVIGAGAIFNNHALAIRAAGERAQFVAVVDIDEARAQQICQQYEIPRWYTSAKAMLEAEHPDLVHVITPPSTHLQLILECLEAGAWVYCEKPLCASLSEFDQISQAEARTRRYVSTVFQWRFGSAPRYVMQMMQSGALGRPLVGVCNTLWYRTAAYYAVPWRGKWATEIGGPTVGLGIHLMDLFLWLWGDWREVRAMIGTLDRAIEFEDVSMALISFENGALGTITNSALSPRQESHLRLDFQHATVEVNALYRYTNENWRFTLPESPSDGLPRPQLVDQWQAIPANSTGDQTTQLRELLDSIDRGERPFVSGAEARRILELIASLYKSAITGQPVVRGSITPDDPFYHSMNGAPTNKI